MPTQRPAESPLCPKCSSLNIEDVFRLRPRVGLTRHIADLGTLGIRNERSACPLCRLFNAVKIPGSITSETSEYALYSSRIPSLSAFRREFVLAVVNKEALRITSSSTILEQEGIGIGFIASAETPALGFHRNSLPARHVQADRMDFGVIREWLSLCAKSHKDCSDRLSSSLEPDNLMLIDCEQRRVVNARPGCRYTALSYVWGQSRSDDAALVSGSNLPKDLPQTIEDSLKVSKELGFNFIWIDRYCINQEDKLGAQRQILQMDLVYKRADVTIVAAAGGDPHFGLPGVNKARRDIQPNAWVDERHLVSILPRPQESIKASTWMRRAWTYQESYFSCRCLVFTQQQVYYECRNALAYETINHFVESSDAVFDQCKLFDNANKLDEFPWTICEHIANYSGRELTYGADALRAFEGVFHDFETRDNPVYHHLGIPLMPPLVAVSRRQAAVSARGLGESFLAGLCWRHTAPGARRTQFPSWTWAGWRISVSHSIPECSKGLQIGRGRKPKAFFEPDGQSAPIDFDLYLSEIVLDVAKSRFIHVESWIIPLHIENKSLSGGEPSGSQCFALFQDSSRCLRIPMSPLEANHGDVGKADSDPIPAWARGELAGVVIGRCEDVSWLEPDDRIFVMVLQNKGSWFERIGHLELGRNVFRKALGFQDGPSTPWELCFHQKEWRTIRIG